MSTYKKFKTAQLEAVLELFSEVEGIEINAEGLTNNGLRVARIDELVEETGLSPYVVTKADLKDEAFADNKAGDIVLLGEEEEEEDSSDDDSGEEANDEGEVAEDPSLPSSEGEEGVTTAEEDKDALDGEEDPVDRGEYVDILRNGHYVRTYSRGVHGSKFGSLAKEFITKDPLYEIVPEGKVVRLEVVYREEIKAKDDPSKTGRFIEKTAVFTEADGVDWKERAIQLKQQKEGYIIARTVA